MTYFLPYYLLHVTKKKVTLEKILVINSLTPHTRAILSLENSIRMSRISSMYSITSFITTGSCTCTLLRGTKVKRV